MDCAQRLGRAVGAREQIYLLHRHRDALLGKKDADAARVGRPRKVVKFHAASPIRFYPTFAHSGSFEARIAPFEGFEQGQIVPRQAGEGRMQGTVNLAGLAALARTDRGE